LKIKYIPIYIYSSKNKGIFFSKNKLDELNENYDLHFFFLFAESVVFIENDFSIGIVIVNEHKKVGIYIYT